MHRFVFFGAVCITTDIFPGRVPDPPLLRATNLKPSAPLLHKEPPPAIVIKQGPLDKRDKAKDRKDKGPSKEEVLKKVSALMDEFATHSNIEEAVNAFKELKTPERFLRHAVYTIYSATLDSSETDRENAAKLVLELKKESAVTGPQIHEGWKELVSSMNEKETTVPRVASYIALLTAMAIVDGLIQLSDVASVTENGQNHPLFLLTLQQLHKTQGN